MPELPEVETVKNTLKKQILGKKINNIKSLYSGIIATDKDEFCKNIVNQEFLDIKRRGKFLIFVLNDYYLVSHLRMEGKFFIKNSSMPIVKHEHLIFDLGDCDLRYHDTRKFGVMKIVKKEDLYNTEEIKKQGIEANSDKLTVKYLKDKFKSKNMPIKTVLLDQEIISGLGNIYADEVLYKSRINPLKKAKELNDKDCENIIASSKIILDKAIKEGGTTIKSYTSSLGVTGNYQNYLEVHKKEGMPCNSCGTKIKRIKVGGRSTYFCEKCQK
jgi:formamidopyrimidine-DNA glycosylase